MSDETIIAFAPTQPVGRDLVAFARERIQPPPRDPDMVLSFGALIAIGPNGDPRHAPADKKQR